jgi:hypothetical protein
MTCSETNWLHGNAGNNRAEISYGEHLLLKPLSVSPYDGAGQRQHVSASTLMIRLALKCTLCSFGTSS